MGVKVEETTVTTVLQVAMDGYNASIEVTRPFHPANQTPYLVRGFEGGARLRTVQRQSAQELREFAHGLLHMIGDE